MKLSRFVPAVWIILVTLEMTALAQTGTAGQTATPGKKDTKEQPGQATQPVAPARAATAAIDPEGAKLLKRFADICSTGAAVDAAGMFAENGELVDETGRVFEGRTQIGAILEELFAAFPQAQFKVTVEGTRKLGKETLIVDGIKQVAASDGGVESRLRIVAVCIPAEKGWQIGSLREYSDPEILTPSLQLKPLEWLVGDWIDESKGGDVMVSCRWSEDGNYLLRSFTVRQEGQVRMKSTQRIGWDPVQKQIRAWHFDSDGSFGESNWSQVGDQWLVRATSTLADGRNGSAMHILTPTDGNKVTWRSTFRIVGDLFEPDRESVMVRQPPRAGGEEK